MKVKGRRGGRSIERREEQREEEERVRKEGKMRNQDKGKWRVKSGQEFRLT